MSNTALTDLIASELAASEVPGAAVAVLQDGAVILSQGFGLHDVDRQLAVDTGTLFPIASCTKAFTATLIGTLVDDGLVDWDEPVRTYLPELRMWDPVATEQLCLRDMLSHRSGLPRHDLVWYGNDDLSRAQAVQALRHLQPSRQLRQTWQYSNLMYLAAGHVAERILGTSWEEAVRTRLLKPLGMSRTVLTHQEAESGSGRSKGYGLVAGELQTVTMLASQVCGPAGSINSCIDDMARWLQANLAADHHGSGAVASEAAMKQLHSPAMLEPRPVVEWPELTSMGYALGWSVADYRGHTLISHGGNLPGFSSKVSYLPEAGIGVVVLTNRGGTPLRDIVPFLVYDHLLELPTRPWGDRFREMTTAMTEGARQVSERRTGKAEVAAQPRPAGEYAGTYRHAAYGTLEVTAAAESITLSLHGTEFAAERVRGDAFELYEGSLDLHLPARFETDFDGQVAAVVLPLEQTVDPIVFDRAPDEVDPAILAGLTGRYDLGPIAARVELVDGSLRLALGAQAADTLDPHRGLTFRMHGEPNTTAEFVLDGTGQPTELVIWPTGRFIRAAEDPH